MGKVFLSKQITVILVLVFVGFLMAACRGSEPVVTPGSTPDTPLAPLPTNTPQPTPTATPMQPLVILLAPPEADASLVADLQDLLADLSSQAGLRFQMRPGLTLSDFQDEVKIVVAIPPASGIGELASAAPETQFLTLMIPGVEPAQNISVVRSQADRPDWQGFSAGYLAAAITPDWRVGVVSELDTPAGNVARWSFTNGVIYFCGLCRSVYPPYPDTGYPLVVQLPPGASQADWQSAVNDFKVWQVGTVYVAPEVAEMGLLNELAQAGINIIGVGQVPPNISSRWVASLGSENPLESMREIWSSLLDGQGNQVVDLRLTIENTNPDLLSPGRQALVEKMIADLMAGYIDTGVDPATGERNGIE
mgnify:FL=1